MKYVFAVKMVFVFKLIVLRYILDSNACLHLIMEFYYKIHVQKYIDQPKKTQYIQQFHS